MELARNSSKKPVAPLTGAWIETLYALSNQPSFVVAPLTGAWIETLMMLEAAKRKLVAPLTGAWIETSIGMGVDDGTHTSHPSRVRGLKHVV